MKDQLIKQHNSNDAHYDKDITFNVFTLSVIDGYFFMSIYLNKNISINSSRLLSFDIFRG